jgi:chromosome segregation ATPase
VEPRSADIAAESSGNPIRELADRLVEEAARASEFRVRLEIAETAESTLREELAEERRRREEAERDHEDLRRELQALRETPEAAETVDEEPQRAELRPATGEAQAATQHQQAQRPTEGVEHDTSTLREWSGDVEGRRQPDSEAGGVQEGAQRPWWRRVFGR